MNGTPTKARPPRRRLWRRVLFPAAALMLGLLPFAVLEIALAGLGLGEPDYRDDPFVGFSAIRPLFVLDKAQERYHISSARQRFFRPESFAAVKAPEEFRIFCLGGSTVQGRPYAIETSFTTWLELSVQAADPSRRWEVVNCGGVSYASYRLVPILQEVLAYGADLMIVYTGHNEFLEDRTYRHIKQTAPLLARVYDPLSRLRTYTLARAGYDWLSGERQGVPPERRPVLGSEVDAILDYRGGLEPYRRDEKWRQDVIGHYQYNVTRMARLTRAAGVPLLLVNPLYNLRDCAPFKAQHRDGLSPKERRRWESLWRQARACYANDDHRKALDRLRHALAIDDQHAGIQYELGKSYEALGLVHEARTAYMQAKELDICPLRILKPMSQAVVAIAHKTGTPLVDLPALFEPLCPGGILGGGLLVDHIHPSIRGHQIVADALADELVRQGFLRPSAGWERERDRRYREHLASLLDGPYFPKGKQRLQGLRRWTQGRADRIPPPGHPAATGGRSKPSGMIGHRRSSGN